VRASENHERLRRTLERKPVRIRARNVAVQYAGHPIGQERQMTQHRRSVDRQQRPERMRLDEVP
jgi:hypothetical protein